ncbi:MAG: aminopeptidase [Candidatus Aenigmarchaeota archaeon]|nr:aminopeptidase [Candidatus Aenigmarchaeota archaeon]
MDLSKGARIAVRQCMNVQSDESVLIITDKGIAKEIPKALFEQSKKITKNVVLKEMIPLERDGQEPPVEISEMMKTPDVLFLVTSRSLSHTDARRNTRKYGVRVASMPKIPISTFVDGGLTADYKEVKENCEKMFDLIKDKESIHLTSENGTDVRLKIGQYILDKDDGIYHKPGSFGNLPGGEVCTAPNKCSTDGVLVIDKMGKYGENIKITIKNGYAIKIEGSDTLKKTVLSLGKDGRNIAEIGIGTNPKAKVIGVILEDEKVYGTVHMALGNNASWGGDCKVSFHDDGIVLKPTLEADGEMLIKDGKWMI